MKKILTIVFWILQIIAFIMEVQYVCMMGWGLIEIVIAFLIAPITSVILPFYMFFISGIWLPLAITILGYLLVGISSILENREVRDTKISDSSINPFSVAGLVLGIVSAFFDRFGVLSLLAIIFSVVALIQIKNIEIEERDLLLLD